jgi:hypothetical protein
MNMGTTVSGFVIKVPSTAAGIFSRKTSASAAASTMCTGSGTNARNRPSANARVTLRRFSDQYAG